MKAYKRAKRLMYALGLGTVLTLGLLLALGAGTLPTAFAATFTVTREDDPPPGPCAPSDCSLREAIIAANATSAQDIIVLPAGTYVLSIPGTDEDDAQTGDLDITANLKLNGADLDTTTIDANAIDRVFDVITGNVTFSGVTIRNGFVEGTTNDDGGGISYRYANGSLKILDSELISNTAGSDGGGLMVVSTADTTTITIEGSAFISNTARSNDGGAFAHDGDNTTITIASSTFRKNRATGTNEDGGAISVDLDLATVTIIGSKFIDNASGQEGGALHLDNNVYTVTVVDSLFRENVSRRGGAINMEGVTASLTIESSDFVRNAAISNSTNLDVEGGAIRLDDNNAILQVADSNFISNTVDGAASDDGGGAIYLEDNGNHATIINSAFDQNWARPSGGAIVAAGNPSTLVISGSSFTANKARDGKPLGFTSNGGGIWFDSDGGTLLISNTTFSQNRAQANAGGIGISGGLTATVDSLGALQAASAARASQDEEEDEKDEAVGRASIPGSSGGLGAQATATKTIQLNNVTIAGNYADNNNDSTGVGGGLGIAASSVGQIDIANTILADNSDRGNGAPDCYALPGVIQSLGYNLVGNSSGCNWTAGPDDQVGTAGSPIDPLLGTLTGDPAYRVPLEGSPAIDAGNPAAVGSGFPACAPVDQRGVIRPRDGRCDIGSVEYKAPEIYLPVVNNKY